MLLELHGPAFGVIADLTLESAEVVGIVKR
jgi:hypothetical protein